MYTFFYNSSHVWPGGAKQPRGVGNYSAASFGPFSRQNGSQRAHCQEGVRKGRANRDGWGKIQEGGLLGCLCSSLFFKNFVLKTY